MKSTVIILLISLFFASGCISLNTYNGIIGFGPEAVYFTECRSNDESWLHKDSWEAINWTAANDEIESQPECSLETMPCQHQSAYVVIKATKSNLGSFGHLGMYPTQLTVKQVVSVQPYDNQCKF